MAAGQRIWHKFCANLVHLATATVAVMPDVWRRSLCRPLFPSNGKNPHRLRKRKYE